jgi:diacylglycerol kinase (ATP)
MHVIALCLFLVLGVVSAESENVDDSNSLSLRSSSVSNHSHNNCPVHMFIFVNSGSGGKKGAELFKIGIRGLGIEVKSHTVNLTVADILEGDSGSKPGFLKISELVKDATCVNKDQPVRIIAAGGDGTVVWCMSEALAHNIDPSSIVFGTIPYGTGNDFAYVYGWGSSPPSHLLKHNLAQLKKLIAEWIDARIVSHDLWDVKISVDSSSGRVIQRSGKRSKKDVLPEGQNFMVKKMSNYFSIGIESRVGYEFDKRRTKSRLSNKVVYAWIGAKRVLGKKYLLNDVLGKCTSGSETIFGSEGLSDPKLVGDVSSIIFVNIPSFAAGIDVWNSSPKMGTSSTSQVRFTDQRSGDRKLEVLTYGTLYNLARERLKIGKGHGKRIAQSEGPFRLAFRESRAVNQIYMQIDGEYYAVENPISIEISHSVTMQVLRRDHHA